MRKNYSSKKKKHPPPPPELFFYTNLFIFLNVGNSMKREETLNFEEFFFSDIYRFPLSLSTIWRNHLPFNH